MKITTNNQKQRGSVLLVMMLILVVSASFVLVSKLNATSNQYARQSSSLSALNEAKAALIGYALTYPDKINANEGPGYLPCPDLDNDGDAEGGCALGGPVNFTIGRFPFETLEVADLRDTSGPPILAISNSSHSIHPLITNPTWHFVMAAWEIWIQMVNLSSMTNRFWFVWSRSV